MIYIACTGRRSHAQNPPAMEQNTVSLLSAFFLLILSGHVVHGQRSSFVDEEIRRQLSELNKPAVAKITVYITCACVLVK